jgi:hypothetical protein
MGSSGVVSTGRVYQFSRCTFSAGSEEGNIVTSREYELTLRPADNEIALRGQLDQINVLLKTIVQLIITQHKAAVDTQDASSTLLKGAVDLREPVLYALDDIENLASQELTEAQLMQEMDEAMAQAEDEDAWAT